MEKILNRLFQTILILFIVSILCFTLTKIAPGDPVLTYVEPNMSEEYINQLREDLGLTKPIAIQYIIWLKNILHGNFGNSLINNRPVLDQILERLPSTMLLMGTSLLLSVILAIPIGLYTGKHKNGLVDKIINIFSYIGISIPTFWFAIIMIYLFSVYLHVLPSLGMRSDGINTFSDLMKHLIMPTCVLTFTNVSQFTRYIRSSTITELSSDYVTVQRAYGMSETGILYRHVLKNAILPMITVLGMSLQGVVSGAIITEQVFAWPGTGQLAVNAVMTFDYPLIMGITMFTALLIVIGNLLADILYVVIDPRIRSNG
ncbi:ABC transporter permease [Anaeromicropila herbilytica]|uniref:Peptide ABC transporter permease n=1 Tax=Anaeromicropila herbilytica TaxID=2785025 RepID=A0A7R7ENG7_9FIRM|nr:ABC transporter permease [Anaeromicropila herbilytica]BCN32185.1 peptide ABC transporter permease [Anaeromicropila herbilytica]